MAYSACCKGCNCSSEGRWVAVSGHSTGHIHMVYPYLTLII